MPPGEATGSVPLEDRFYDFVTKDFPDFRKETGERLTGVETQMKGVQGRLKKIEGNGSISPAKGGGESKSDTVTKGALVKWLPWIITALISGAALGGGALVKALG